MKILKRIISVGLISILSLGVLAGCDNIGKNTTTQISLKSEYNNVVNKFVEYLEEFIPEVERLFSGNTEGLLTKERDDIIALGEDIRSEITRVHMAQVPKAFKESDEMLKSGLSKMSKVARDMENPKEKLNTKKERDGALDEISNGIQKITESIDYRTENEID